MNERPKPAPFREGFVDPKAQQPPAGMPPPELEPSPAEQDETASPVAMEIAQDTWPVVVRLLYKPLVIPGGPTYTELSFREPRGGDINRYGNPCRVNQEGDVLIEERKMHYIMAALSGVLPPYLEMLDPRDWNSCAYRLRHFFAPDPRAWLSATTTP